MKPNKIINWSNIKTVIRLVVTQLIKQLYLMPLILNPTICFSSQDNVETAGDYLQVILPAVAFGSSYFFDDQSTPDNLRYKQFVKSFSLGLATTHLLKFSLEKRRPNGNNENSFPSGHTFAAFSSAAFINSRFGAKYGLPSYLLAGFVGYSRVKSQNHFADDVFAGALIGYLYNEYFTIRSEDTVVNLNLEKDNYNVNIQVPLDTYQISISHPLGISFLIGPIYIQELLLNDSTRKAFDLFSLPREENYNYSTLIQLNYDINSKRKFLISLFPYEQIVYGQVGTDLQYGSKKFSSQELVEFSWRQFSFDFEFLQTLKKMKSFGLAGGIGALVNFGEIEISSLDETTEYKSQRLGVVGSLILEIKCSVGNFSSILTKLNWFDDSKTRYVKLGITYSYKLTRRWAALLQVQHDNRKLTFAEINNGTDDVNIETNSSFNSILLGLRYSL